jgi:nucleoside-diphosphate-sugar epimerase
MIAVVTGSSGFIGSHLVEALLARGATVRALARTDSPTGGRTTHVGYWTADLLDSRSVRESPVWEGATHVFHVGGVTKARTLHQFRDGNVVPTTNILAALAARGERVERFVLVSSLAAAGPATAADRPVREDDTSRPIEAYGASKLEAELATRQAMATLPAVIVRPASVYGPRDVDFLNIFKQATGPLAVYAAHRNQLLSLVHVRDLVRALLAVADAPAAIGRTYHVADERPATWRELYASIAALAGTNPMEVQLPGPLLTLAGQAGSLLSLVTGRAFLVNANKVALSRPRWWTCDSTRIRADLGWRAETPLQEGLRETYLWYLRAGWLPSRRTAAERADLLEE